MGEVGILPALVEHAAIGHDHGAPSVLLVAREGFQARTIRVHAVKVGHGGVAVHAGHGVVEGRAGEDDAPIGKVAGIIVVDVRIVVPGHLPGLAGGEVELKDVPCAVLFANGGEEGFVGIPVKINIADEGATRGAEDLLGLRLRIAHIKPEKGVVIAALGGFGIALPVGREPRRPFPAEEEEFLEIDGRVVRHH